MLKRLLTLSNFKFYDPRITLGAVVAITTLTTANLVAELTINLETTPTEIMVLFWVFSIMLFAAFLKWPKSQIISTLIVVLAFSMLEAILVSSPKSFHSINFWLVLIPVASLILQGVRHSVFWTIMVLAAYGFNTAWIMHTHNGTYEIVVRSTPYLFTHFIFLSGVISASYLLYALLAHAYERMRMKSEELHQLQENVQQKKNRLEHYQQSLIALNKNNILFGDNQQSIYQLICLIAAQTLGISRVSIWLLVNRNTMLVRKHLYENLNASDEIVFLNRNDYPAYFNALETKPVVMADDAFTHEDTWEFAENYLKSLNICSMLDCPIKVGRKLIGVICCENQNAIRNWHPEEALYVQSMADIVAMSFQNERIKQLLRQIRNQNHELVEKTNSIETMNEELTSLNEELISLNNQLTRTNERLEEAVKKRTEELQIQNKQLTEYAFINSHLLRAPLARLLGLSQLVSMEVSSVKDRDLITALQYSAKELDEIVRKITEILYAGNPMSREDIKAIVDKNLTRLN